jgi:hypothetical protein
VLAAGCWVLAAGYWVLGAGCWVKIKTLQLGLNVTKHTPHPLQRENQSQKNSLYIIENLHFYFLTIQQSKNPSLK